MVGIDIGMLEPSEVVELRQKQDLFMRAYHESDSAIEHSA
jgi:hypothetical protein